MPHLISPSVCPSHRPCLRYASGAWVDKHWFGGGALLTGLCRNALTTALATLSDHSRPRPGADASHPVGAAGAADADAVQQQVQQAQSQQQQQQQLQQQANASQARQLQSSSDLPVADVQLPPEIISYVDTSRNPDIYTREFVELVQRGNQDLKGKRAAFVSFRDVLARELRSAMPECRSEVDRVLALTGGADSSGGDDDGGGGNSDGNNKEGGGGAGAGTSASGSG